MTVRSAPANLLTLLILITAPSSAQPITVYDSHGFDSYSVGPLHGQDGGSWHPGVTASGVSPMYRHWEVKSGQSNATIAFNPFGGGKAIALSGFGFDDAEAWLQLGWEGDYSAGHLHGLDPQITTIEFRYHASSSRGFTMTTYRNAQQAEQIRIADHYTPFGRSHSFRSAIRKRFSEGSINWRSHGVHWGGSVDVKVIIYHPRPPNAQGPNGQHGFVRIFLNGAEVTATDLEFYYTIHPVWTGWIDAVKFEPGEGSWGETAYIDDVRVTWDRYSPPSHVERMSFFDYRPADFMPGGAGNWASLGVAENLMDLNEGAQRRITQYLDVQRVFFVPNRALPGNPRRLRADYQQCWKALTDLIAGYVNHGHIKGIYLGDEVVWWGVPFSELQAAAQLVSATYPQFPIMLSEPAAYWFVDGKNTLGQWVFGGPPPPDWEIPPEIDVLVAHRYGFVPYTFAEMRQIYNTYVYPRLPYPHQRLIIVPEAFGVHPSDPGAPTPPLTIPEWDAAQAQMADHYYFWSILDSRITGFMPWHWDRLRNPQTHEYTWYGTNELPTTKLIWQSIGRMITESQVLPPAIPKRVTGQHFNSFGHGEPLPSTYAVDPVPVGEFVQPPPIDRVHFWRPAGDTHIRLVNASNSSPFAAFRYGWGTTWAAPWAVDFQWPGDPTQFVFFDVYYDTSEPFHLRVTPLRGEKTPVELNIDTRQQPHLSFRVETTSGWIETPLAGVVLQPGWNRVAARIMLNDMKNLNDNQIRWILNGQPSQFFPVPGWKSITDEQDVVFTTIKFELRTPGEVLLDIIGMRDDNFP